jgi:predicted patatin/cPLA2 family phospholipase
MDHLEIIHDYKNNRDGCVRDDKVIKYCKNAPDLKTAIIRAAMAKGENGNKHPHQRRYIRDDVLKKLANKLIEREKQIKNIKNFDELFEIIVRTYVFNNEDSLTVYDTALRIGFYLNKFPEKIYIHAGAKKGAEKIRGKIENHFVMKKYLPEPFKSSDLAEYELEDLFCVYKDEL